MRNMLAALWIATGLSVSGCGGGGTTGPSGGGDLAVSIGGILENTSFSATITGAQLLFDGRLMSTATSASGDALVALSGVLTGVSTGKHTIEFKLTSHSVSSANYKATQVVVTYGSTGAITLYLPDISQDLSAGQSIRYAISF